MDSFVSNTSVLMKHFGDNLQGHVFNISGGFNTGKTSLGVLLSLSLAFTQHKPLTIITSDVEKYAVKNRIKICLENLGKLDMFENVQVLTISDTNNISDKLSDISCIEYVNYISNEIQDDSILLLDEMNGYSPTIGVFYTELFRSLLSIAQSKKCIIFTVSYLNPAVDGMSNVRKLLLSNRNAGLIDINYVSSEDYKGAVSMDLKLIKEDTSDVRLFNLICKKCTGSFEGVSK